MMGTSMDENSAWLPANFNIRSEYGYVCLEGERSLRSTVELVKEAIRYSRERKIYKLLVDATEVWGYAPPSFIERFLVTEELAEEASGVVKMAVALCLDLIDPANSGATVAQRTGLAAQLFQTKDEGARWLTMVIVKDGQN
jgi:hypothetical protein